MEEGGGRDGETGEGRIEKEAGGGENGGKRGYPVIPLENFYLFK